MFEKASRMKLRFDCRGLCNVEDLWDLPLSELDDAYKNINIEIKTTNEDSLLTVKSKESELLELKREIIKYVVSTRLTERKAAEDSEKRAQMKQRLMEIRDKKKDEKYLEMSEEELTKAIDEI